MIKYIFRHFIKTISNEHGWWPILTAIGSSVISSAISNSMQNRTSQPLEREAFKGPDIYNASAAPALMEKTDVARQALSNPHLATQQEAGYQATSDQVARDMGMKTGTGTGTAKSSAEASSGVKNTTGKDLLKGIGTAMLLNSITSSIGNSMVRRSTSVQENSFKPVAIDQSTSSAPLMSTRQPQVDPMVLEQLRKQQLMNGGY